MITSVPPISSNDLTSEACAWIAQLETADLSHEDLAAFREWMGRSPAHQSEIRRLAYLSDDINIIAEMAESLKLAANTHKRVAPRTSWFSLKVTMVTMAVLLSFFSLTILYPNTFSSELAGPILITTDIGQHREITLADGSVIQLNTDSTVEVDYDQQRRKVRLIRGEAFFEVAHNTSRPFYVYVGEKRVRAVGTSFLVRHLKAKFELTVTEGRVELIDTPSLTSKPTDEKVSIGENLPSLTTATSKPEQVYLDAGESIQFKTTAIPNTSEPVKAISASEIKRKLAWESGFLEFSNTSLTEVIQDLQRYTPLSIQIDDPVLAELKFGGIFKTNDISALFEALELQYDLEVVYLPNNSVSIKRKNNTES